MWSLSSAASISCSAKWTGEFGLLCLFWREHVALATNGEKDFGITRIVAQFIAKVRDVHIDGARNQSAGIQAPDALKNLVARDRPSGIGGKVAQQFAFARGQGVALAVVMSDFGTAKIGDPGREFDHVGRS